MTKRYRCKENGNLTEADKRFFALRESGYRGPIDQDGYPATDPKLLEVFAALDGHTTDGHTTQGGAVG